MDLRDIHSKLLKAEDYVLHCNNMAAFNEIQGCIYMVEQLLGWERSESEEAQDGDYE